MGIHHAGFASGRYDAVVVGARCAGAATALLLARRGLRVLAVDRGQYGTDTLSTHALMRGAVLQLAEWGVLEALDWAGTPVVRSTSFHYAGSEVRIPIKARGGIPGLLAPRRYLLDRALVDAARSAGAAVAYGLRVSDLARDKGGIVTGVELEDANGARRRVEASIVIGADGLRSTVARLASFEVRAAGRHSSGVVYGYFSGLANDGFHWHFRPGASAGRIPTNDGQSCVFASVSTQRFHDEVGGDVPAAFDRLLEEVAPDLAEAVRAGHRHGSLRGFAGQPGFMRRAWRPGVALVGDASYFKDPITAHGITDALRDAELLAEAVAEGGQQALARYERRRDELALAIFAISDRIASYAWDLAELEALHLKLSEEMKREVEELEERHALALGRPA